MKAQQRIGFILMAATCRRACLAWQTAGHRSGRPPLVTEVAKGAPADGVLENGDVVTAPYACAESKRITVAERQSNFLSVQYRAPVGQREFGKFQNNKHD